MQSARLGSSSSFSGAPCTPAASIGTFVNVVNRDLLSKDTMISLSRIISLLMVDTK